MADLLLRSFQVPPSGTSVPDAREIQAIGAHGATASVSHRRELMNRIGSTLGVPAGVEPWSVAPF